MIAFLNFQKKLSDAQIENMNSPGFFSHIQLRKSIFAVVAKDNIDCNATSPIPVKHFHGTSMTVTHFHLTENFANNNSMPACTQLIHEQTKKASKKY